MLDLSSKIEHSQPLSIELLNLTLEEWPSKSEMAASRWTVYDSSLNSWLSQMSCFHKLSEWQDFFLCLLLCRVLQRAKNIPLDCASMLQKNYKMSSTCVIQWKDNVWTWKQGLLDKPLMCWIRFDAVFFSCSLQEVGKHVDIWSPMAEETGLNIC